MPKTLATSQDEKAVVTLWEAGDLIEKSFTGRMFVNEICKWEATYTEREHIYFINKNAIWSEKCFSKLSFDFAENSAISMLNEV